MRNSAVLALVVAAALAVAPAASAKRLKSYTFCGPETCWGMPARMGDVFASGHATPKPRVAVRFYRGRMNYSPSGSATIVFAPSLGIVRGARGWWKVSRPRAEALRHATRGLKAFGPRRF